jgi:phosphoglycolate phosphatase-like HAD superfamily hydrolase
MQTANFTTAGGSMPFLMGLLDWNGTIVDDVDIAYAATVYLFEQLAPRATVPSIEEYRKEFSAADMLQCYYQRGMPRTVTPDMMYRLWSGHYESLSRNMQLADGAQKLLCFLQQCGITLVLVSAGPKEIVRHVERMNIAHLFDRMCFEATDKSAVINGILQRENVDAHDAFYVGDTVGDIVQGKRAGVITFGYTNGYHWPDLLRQAKPKYLVDSLLDVLSIVRAQIPVY